MPSPSAAKNKTVNNTVNTVAADISEDFIDDQTENTVVGPKMLQITMNEAEFLYKMIEEMTRRAAFKPKELRDVGVMYERLEALIQKSTEE